MKGLGMAGLLVLLVTGPALAAGGHDHSTPPPAVGGGQGAAAQPGGGRILFYRNPAGLPDTSPVPKRDAQGREYLPVYARDLPAGGVMPDPFAEPAAPVVMPDPFAPMPGAVVMPDPFATPAPPANPVRHDHSAPRHAPAADQHDHSAHQHAAPPPGPSGKGKILYYRNPMGLPDVSPVPKKDSMGMDYIPVYEGEGGGPTLKVSLDKVQKLGVRTEVAALRRLERPVRAVGSVVIDERREVVVAPKFEGWIERLNVNTTGQAVRRGESLFEVYSPELVLAQQEYLVALGKQGRGAGQLVEGALERLRNWDIAESQLQRLRESGRASRTLSLEAPRDGVVLEKGAVQGMRFMPGEVLYRIADLSHVWVLAEVFEQDLGVVAVGQKAEVTINSLPGQTFRGQVGFIYPTLDPATRTVKVRVELPNPDGRLRPALYAIVTLRATLAEGQVLTVPDSAVLDSGQRQVVLVEEGEGRYRPQVVTPGARADGYVHILEGLKVGERVVVRANFLIDAESNLRAALEAFQPQ